MVAPMAAELPVSLKAVTDRVATDWTGPRVEMDEVAYLQFTAFAVFTDRVGAVRRQTY